MDLEISVENALSQDMKNGAMQIFGATARRLTIKKP